jgi:ferritin-like metal-binding protein YciE
MLSTLKDLYIEQLRDLYDAENRLTEALPKMAAAANHNELKKAFEEHLEETRGQINRLNQIFDDLGVSPQGETCNAMQGLITEGQETMEEQADPNVKDAALIAAAQRVEHYEIAGYGTVKSFAKALDYHKHASLLDDTLSEESDADDKLNKVATGGLFGSGVNKEALATA